MEQLGQPRDKVFRRRLGIYLTGVAIGLIMLGFVQVAKRSMTPPPAGDSATGTDSQPPAQPNTAPEPGTP